jgi:hypothetical protein
MALFRGDNKADVEGDNNIVIQGCSDSTFTIQQIDIAQLETKLQEMLGQDSIVVVVLSTDLAQLENELSKTLPFSVSEVRNRYGATPADWQPFGIQESILAILTEFEKQSGFKIRPFFIDWRNVKIDTAKKRTLKDRRKKVVLIADIVALHSSGNQTVAKLFNEPEAGGCLIPICQTHTENVMSFAQKKVNEIFDDLQAYVHSYCDYISNCSENKGYLQFDLQVWDKHVLFRRLTHIACFCLSMKPKVLVSGLAGIEDDIPNLV